MDDHAWREKAATISSSLQYIYHKLNDLRDRTADLLIDEAVRNTAGREVALMKTKLDEAYLWYTQIDFDKTVHYLEERDRDA